MSNIKDTQVNAGPASSQASSIEKPRVRGLVGKGLLAAVAASAATTLAAALAKAAGVKFEIPDSGETIPLCGIAFVTTVLSIVGGLIAAALLRWSKKPAKRWVQVTVAPTAISPVPPSISGASQATAFAFAGRHLVAAVVMIRILS